ncbi:hypothetical protein AB0O28_19000 [Microbispora sp. NPDC088329]|uniref:hypothetical protein n=1 Tax=Microbispora sp. NPDC088329 TaxID=3154869 RepID=UPI003428D302
MAHDRKARAVVFNAIQPALARTGDWVRLRARRNVAEAVLAALAKHGLAVVPAADVVDRDEPESTLGQRYADTIRSVPIQLTPSPATTAMLQAYAPFHLSEEETAPLVDAVFAVRDDELAEARRQWQDLRERLAEETWKREQAEAAIARVRAAGAKPVMCGPNAIPAVPVTAVAAALATTLEKQPDA